MNVHRAKALHGFVFQLPDTRHSKFFGTGNGKHQTNHNEKKGNLFHFNGIS